MHQTKGRALSALEVKSDEPVMGLFYICNEGKCQYAQVMNFAKSWIPFKAGVNRLTVVLTSIGGKLRRKRIRNQLRYVR
jgi:hypothetical protein